MKRRGGKHNGRLLHFIIFNDILIEDKRRYEQEKRERKKRKIFGDFPVSRKDKDQSERGKVRWVYERQKR